MCSKNQKLYLQGIWIIEEFIHLYNRSLITARIRPNWMTKHDLITCWCLLLKNIPLRINGTLIPSLTRAKPNESCGEIMWHSSLLQLVRHVMMSQRLLPLTRPPSDSCKMSPQRQTVWHYLSNHHKLESNKKKTSLIHEGNNSLEGLLRKGLLESQLTYKNVSRTLRFPCSHHTGNGQMKRVLFWWMLGESLWICDDGIE